MVGIERLNNEENIIFDHEYDELTKVFSDQREIWDIFQRHRASVFHSCEVAKKEFKGDFWGIDAQTGFGWSLIRPEFLRRRTTDTGVTRTEWDQFPAVPGWADWIVGAAAGQPIQINEDCMLVLLAHGNYSPSVKSYAAKYQIGNHIYPIWYFEWGQRLLGSSGLKVWEFPKTMVVTPRTNMYVRLKYSATGLDIPLIHGIAFAEASYLQTETPTLQAP